MRFVIFCCKQEFESWKSILSESQQKEATGFFTVIRRESESGQLYIVPYSKEYASPLTKAAGHLQKAADLATTPRHKTNSDNYANHILALAFPSY